MPPAAPGPPALTAERLLVGLVLFGFGLARVALDPLGLVADDFVNLAQAADAPSLPELLARPVFGRWVPTHRLVHWLLGHDGAAPAWGAVATLLAAVSAGQLAALALALRSLRVDRRVVVLLCAWLAVAPTRFDSLRWLASAVHVDLHLVLVLAGLVAALRAGQGGPRAWSAAALVAWALALGAYEKALVAVPAAAALAWSESRSPASRRLLVGALLLTAGLGVVIGLQGRGSAHAVAPGDLAATLARLLAGPLALAAGPRGFGAAGLALAAAGLVAFARAPGRALAGLALAAAVGVALVLPVAVGRLPELGPALGDVPRYSAELPVLVALAVGLLSRGQRTLRPLVLLLALGLLPSAWRARAAVEAARWAPGLEARAWADRVRAQLRPGAAAPLLEGEVPGGVVEAPYFPWTRVHVVLGLLAPGSVRPLEGERRALRLEGAELVSVALAPGEPGAWSVKAPGCEVSRDERAVCVHGGAAGCFAEFTAEVVAGDGPLGFTVELPAPRCVGVHALGEVYRAGWPRCRPSPGGWRWVPERAGLRLGWVDLDVGAGERVCLARPARWAPAR